VKSRYGLSQIPDASKPLRSGGIRVDEGSAVRSRRSTITPRVLQALLLLLLAATPLAAQEPAASESSLPLLTQAEQIRELPRERAALGYPVHLQAVVTYYDPDAEVPDLYIQDSTAGIRVETSETKLSLRPGQLVEVRGVSSAPDFVPDIQKALVRILGEARVPPPRTASFERMASGAEDSQWVEAEGIVRSAAVKDGHLVLGLATDGGRLTARIPGFHGPVPAGLVDARVLARGACRAIFNKRNQLLGVSLRVPRLADVSIKEQAPDPLTLSVRRIDSLMAFTPKGTTGHRVRVQGVVTLQRLGQRLFIQDESVGISIRTEQMTRVEIGDRVDVAGFPKAGRFSPMLDDAVFRKIGSAPPPAPVDVNVSEALEGNQDAELVRIEAQLLDRWRRPGQQILVLRSGPNVFNGYLSDSQGKERLASLKEGSRLQLTGICEVHLDEDRAPRSFRILLRTPADVVVVRRPSWWTTDRALRIAILLAISIAIMSLWTISLRRRVEEQTEIMRAILESTADGILVVNAHGKVVTFNQKFIKTWPLPESILATRDRRRGLESVVPELKESEAFLASIEKLRADAEAQSDDLLEFKDGRVFELHSEPLRIGLGSIGRVWGFRDITDRKRAEEAIAQLASIVEASDDAIIGTTLDGTIVNWNSGAEKLYGYSSEEMKGRPASLLAPSDRAQEVPEILDRLALGEHIKHYETQQVRKDDKRIDVSLTISPINDAAGRIGGVCAIARDITDRKQAEEALRRSEERFSKAFNASPEPITISTLAEGRYIDANDSFLRLTGYEREEMVGRTSRELQFWGEPEQQSRVLQVLTNKAAVRDVEVALRTKSGALRVGLLSAEIIRIGDEPCLLAVTKDITERKEAEEALRQSEERYRSLFERNLAGVYRTSLDGRILDGNEALARILGYDSAKELQGKRALDLYHDARDREVFVGRLRQHKSLANFESRLRRKDGSLCWVLENASLLESAGNDEPTFEGTLIDITEAKQAEEELRQLSGRLARSQDEERRRIARELHDSTAQGLTAMVMNLRAVNQSAARLSQKARGILAETITLAEQCAKEIRTLSYLLHPPMLDEFGLASALRWYVQGFDQRSGIRVGLDMPAELQRLPGAVEMTIFRIVQESLVNVHRHSGSKKADIRMLLESNHAILEVKDYGRGIDSNGGSGSNGTKLKDAGIQMGVGIHGMQERVRELGGSLEIDSSRQGTTVRAILPVSGENA